MANVFAGSEVVEMGIQIEKNGRDFYNTLLGQSQDEQAKEVFRYLAEQEERHIETFQKILDSVQKYESPESYPGEYFAYMKSFAGQYVFTQENKGEEIAKTAKNDRDAIDLGVNFEKDSIIFYEDMKRVVPENQNKILDELICQEKDHLYKLLELKKD